MTESAVPATDTASLTLILALAAALIFLAFEPMTHRATRPRPVPPTPRDGNATGRLLGQVTREQLAAQPGWGRLDGRDYTPDAATMARLQGFIEGVHVLVFMGVWCIDSVRELPRFWKVADSLALREEQVTIYALDRAKRDAAGMAERWQIAAIPTFILLDGEQELGRIVERPRRSLEADWLDIVQRPERSAAR